VSLGANGRTEPELDREQEWEGAMTSQIEIRVTLKNLPVVKERLDQEAIDRLFEGIGSYLQKRLRGTDHMERDARGEFCISIRNVDSNCLPSLQRRFSAMMLDSHFSKPVNGSMEFAVETSVLACQAAALLNESLDELPYAASREFAHRR
jgi:hypothetical protein